jgi:hypothetical protein
MDIKEAVQRVSALAEANGIPVLEQRLGNVERDVAHLQPAPANAAESDKLLAAKDAG